MIQEINSLTKEEIVEAAIKLNSAEKNRKQIPTFTSSHPVLTMDDAYRIQDKWIDIKVSSGSKVIGHKIGLTSKVMQEAFGIDEPDFGVLLDEMLYSSGSVLKRELFIEPRIEVELAFVLKSDIDPHNISHNSILNATEKIIPAMELIDFRTRGDDTEHARTVFDTISDNAANGAIIIGDAEIPHDHQLQRIKASLLKNDEEVATGETSAILGHPLNSVIWLAKKYTSYERILKAGQIILAGSFIAPIPVNSGDHFAADFGEFGKVTCAFE